jgi:hypothetical protein
VAEDNTAPDYTSSSDTAAPAQTPDAGAASPDGTQTSADHIGDTTTESGRKQTLLDAVLKVVPADTEGDVLAADKPTDAPASPAIDDGDQADQGSESNELTEADTVGMGPSAAKKFKVLLRQRGELRDHIASLQPVAEIGGQLANFARENDLSSDDIVKAVSLAAAVRVGDWQSFYQQVGPFVRRAQEYLGLVLPDDLGHRVQQGHMTEAMAREYARTRFDAAKATAVAQQRETEIQTSRVQNVQADVQRAVANFETQLAARDPDYRAKADAIRRTTQAILHERGGQITSAQEALDIVQAAHAEVTQQYRRLMPAPRATHPVPNGNSQQPSARAQPKTLMEAALQGLERARQQRA